MVAVVGGAAEEAGFQDAWGGLGDTVMVAGGEFGSALMGIGCKEDAMAMTVHFDNVFPFDHNDF